MVKFGSEPMFLEQMLPQGLKMMIVQHRDSATTATHEMMMRPLLNNFVNGRAIDLRVADHLQLVEKGQCPIDGCPIDRRGYRRDPFINLVDGGVAIERTERVQNKFTLGGKPVAHLANLL